MPTLTLDELAKSCRLYTSYAADGRRCRRGRWRAPGHAGRAGLTPRSTRARLPAAKASLASSSGIFLGQSFRFDLARPGSALYGINPTPGLANPMRSVVELKGRVLQLRKVPAGETVGYGATWTAKRATRMAVVAVGYADGFLRAASATDAVTIGRTITIRVSHEGPDGSSFDAPRPAAESR